MYITLDIAAFPLSVVRVSEVKVASSVLHGKDWQWVIYCFPK